MERASVRMGMINENGKEQGGKGGGVRVRRRTKRRRMRWMRMEKGRIGIRWGRGRMTRGG